jgi:hypothetical protein
MLGLQVTDKHMAADDPEYFEQKIKYILDNDVSDENLCLELTFSEDVIVPV